MDHTTINDFPRSSPTTLALLAKTDAAYRNMNKFRFVRPIHPPCHEIFKTDFELDKNYANDDAESEVLYVSKELNLTPIFPVNTKHHTERLPDDQLQPRYMDRWPIGFDKKEWDDVWAKKPLPIDKYLLKIRIGHRSSDETAIRERTYLGVAWRLRIDVLQAERQRMPILRQGTVLSYQRSHTQKYRYVIDHCVFRDRIEAYLRVYCFDKAQAICSNKSNRPSFLLIVPIEYSQVRDYPRKDLAKFKSSFRLSSSSLPYVSDLYPASKFSIDKETVKSGQLQRGTVTKTGPLARLLSLFRKRAC